MTTIIANHIDGRATAPLDGTYLDDIDPSTGRVHALVPASEAADVDAAVEAAKRAFPGWSSTPAAERSRILLRIADRLEARLEAFVRAESVDSGKPVRLARSLDIPRAVANLRFFATAILHTGSDLFPTDDRALNYTLRRPRGVAGPRIGAPPTYLKHPGRCADKSNRSARARNSQPGLRPPASPRGTPRR